MMKKIEILHELESLVDDFSSDNCIDYAYSVHEGLQDLIDRIVGEEEDGEPEPTTDWTHLEDKIKEWVPESDTPEYDSTLIDAIVDAATHHYGKLEDDLMQGQYMWNQVFDELHTDSIEGEDMYSMCVGFQLAMGYTPDQAHNIASHGKTNLR